MASRASLYAAVANILPDVQRLADMLKDGLVVREQAFAPVAVWTLRRIVETG